MKILILANSSKGLFGFRQELITELLKTNTVCAYTPDNGSVQEINALGCRVCDLPLDRRGINPWKDFSLLCRILTVLKKEKPDFVITYTIKPNIYGGLACRLLGVSYAVNITGLGTAFQNNGMLRCIVTTMYRIGLKGAKTVFFENEENRTLFINEGIVPEDRTCLLMGAGVNLTRYHVTDYPAGETTKFLFMGRVMKEKGIDELFEAMHRLSADGVSCSLDVLGGYEENYKDNIQKYESEGWLHYHGYQKDVRPYIANCHCFVLPSWHEGMANTNLECAASGRPVITSRIHGCMEAVIEGKTGFLCERKNAQSLYEAMKHFCEIPWEEKCKMGLEGRKHMEDVFDKKIVVKKTMERISQEAMQC